MPLTRRSFLVLGSAAALAGPAQAYVLAELYRGRTIVTGRRAETRIPGMVRALTKALVRVSGDSRLAASPALARFTAAPEAAVIDYTYRDLYAFRPIKDEQGTRDRPYEMTVRYDPLKIDAMLAALGSRPWLGPRPRLVVFLAVHHIGTTFMLDAKLEQGELMRESFQDAAWSAATEVLIPSPKTITSAGLMVDGMPGVKPDQLLAHVDGRLGQIPLLGQLDWSKELLAWKARWRLASGGAEQSWGIAGVNFDAAFRNGVGGAAQILSGNGTPA